MKKLTTILSFTLVLFMAMSCSKSKSLQSYLVESQEKDGFFYGDVPVSSLMTTKSGASEEVLETMKTIKKINVAFLRKTADNDAAYENEKNELNKILGQDDYKNLMTMKMKGMNVKVYYTGDTDSIDEIITFGYNKEAGVGVARLLGENINPAKIIQMMQSIQMDGDRIQKQFGGLF
ncbi:MAG: hypothetical protein CMB99_14850 [Flavobacteriaceae bacterium]|nr:hypothetical protein [Flavobacteriaceae bacterium]|tara:strand:+ start:262460 stop:262990 length:531 start_codon:yes stop_codon:yes gene_type:complete